MALAYVMAPACMLGRGRPHVCSATAALTCVLGEARVAGGASVLQSGASAVARDACHGAGAGRRDCPSVCAGGVTVHESR